jgi:predicted alpha/beta superfamily hydrolase/predicted negative regulator of RcsB-dependent stress response
VKISGFASVISYPNKKNMKKAVVLIILVAVISIPVFPQADGDDIAVGKYRKLFSGITNEERTLLIRIPRSYDESGSTYPVLFLLYGQNLAEYFLPAITACDGLAGTGSIPETIIVGVANAERYRDYSSIKDGFIENTARFFREELIPFIDSHYRTKDFRILAGPQAGAVFSFYTLMNHPDLFNAYIMENPFTGRNRELLLKQAGSFFSHDRTLNRFLYISEENNNNPENIEALKRFSEMLDSGMPSGFRYIPAVTDPSGYFVPPLPLKESLICLFDTFSFPPEKKNVTLKEIKQFYSYVGSFYGTDFQPPEIILTFRSDDLMAAGRYDAAAEVLEYQLSLYPQSLNALLRMGDLQRIKGNYDAAIEYYDAFLKIGPTDAVFIRNKRNSLERYMKESMVYILEKDIDLIGIDKAIRNFRKQKAAKDNALTFTENELNSLGYALLNRNRVKESIKVFRLGIENFPASANLYDSLGEAYLRDGDKANAIRNYEKSLEMDPGNENARKVLEQEKDH